MSEVKSRVVDILEPMAERLERTENLQLLELKQLTRIESLLRELVTVTRETHDGLEELRSHVGESMNRTGTQVHRNTTAIMNHEGRIKHLENETTGNGHTDAE